jgi:hypothetical protein
VTEVEQQGEESSEPIADQVAEATEEVVEDHPWLEHVAQLGWLAKGIVYTLMGITAAQIAQLSRPSDDASPEGSIGRIADAPAGRLLLAVLCAGLLLYFLWRLMSIAVLRGHDASTWADRLGYAGSGLFYLLLAVVAARAAISGHDPEDSNSVERISRSLMDHPAGRWVLAIGGLAVIAVGLYFIIEKGVRRSFVDDLQGVGSSSSQRGFGRTLRIAGVAGWIGRGMVTVLVGYFVVRSAYRFDPDDARGFDRSLRQVAGTTPGTALVWVCAIGLIAYGVFCLLSHRSRRIA